MPPVGLTLGAIFLGEVVDVRLVVGAVLIVAGVALVNLRLRRGAAPAQAVAAAEPCPDPCPIRPWRRNERLTPATLF